MGSNDCRFGNVEWGLGNCHLQFYQLEFHLVHREKRKVRKALIQNQLLYPVFFASIVD